MELVTKRFHIRSLSGRELGREYFEWLRDIEITRYAVPRKDKLGRCFQEAFTEISGLVISHTEMKRFM